MKTATTTFDEKRARAELLGIADDLRAARGRARALRKVVEGTAEFRRAQGLARKGDHLGASRVLVWFWSGGLGDVILALNRGERQYRSDSRRKKPW